MVYKNEVHEEHEVQELHGVIFMYRVTIILKVLHGKAADGSICKRKARISLFPVLDLLW